MENPVGKKMTFGLSVCTEIFIIGERRERSRTIEAEAVLVYCNIDPLLPSKLRMLVKGGGSSPGNTHTVPIQLCSHFMGHL